MGKPTGFLDYERKNNKALSPKTRIKNFKEFHVPMDEEERVKQAARCMNCGVPFCQYGQMIGGMASGCPLNNLVPEWNDLLYMGNKEKAYKLLSETNNFPEFTSRVCPALCEAACTCGLNDEAVSSKENEYNIIENAFLNNLISDQPPKVKTGKKIAVIGSGPSGLAAADQLCKRGHEVTVYEKNDHIGGLLMYGIPNMKLEKWVIDRRQEVMEREGVIFKTGINVGKDITAKELTASYDACILCCGAGNPRDIKAKGREAKNIFFAVDFLTRSTKHVLGKQNSDWVDTKGLNVVVIGGGDTGNDCIGTAVRQGAKSVTQLEMMPKLPDERAENNPWPEWPRVCKTDYGQEEAIAVYGHDPRIYQTTVKEFIADKNGNIKKLILIKLSPEKDPKTGRMNMKEVAGSEYEIPADVVLIAAGFLGCEEYVAKDFKVSLSPRTNIATAAGSYATDKEKVFTAGDMHRGQSLVVWAIHEGREAASEVDQKLMGYTNLN